MNRPDISLAQLGMTDEGPVALVEAAGAAGFASVGLPLRSGALRPLRTEIVGDAELVRAIRAACRQAGVTVFDVEALVLGHEPPADALEALFETAAELGASRVSCLGYEAAHGSGSLPTGGEPERLAWLAGIAGRHDLAIGVEFMAFRSIGTLAAAAALVREAGAPNLRVIVDALHAFRTGVTPCELAGLPAGIVSHLQLCDAASVAPPAGRLAEEARSGRLLPGEGAVPLAAYVAALPPGTPLSLEMPIQSLSALSVAERARRGAASLACL
jgi:sugar phosphate isomerase/epimerase